MSDLKPCPFCGGKADYSDAIFHEVGCADCDVLMISLSGKDAAVKRWNRRAEQENENE